MPGWESMPPRERRNLCIALPLLALLVGWHGISDRGLMRLHRLEQQVAAVRATNAALEKDIQDLTTQIGRLEHDDRYFEEFARRRYGLIRKNEIIFQFKKR